MAEWYRRPRPIKAYRYTGLSDIGKVPFANLTVCDEDLQTACVSIDGIDEGIDPGEWLVEEDSQLHIYVDSDFHTRFCSREYLDAQIAPLQKLADSVQAAADKLHSYNIIEALESALEEYKQSRTTSIRSENSDESQRRIDGSTESTSQ